MLKGIDPLLSPQLLKVLSLMGHRHEIAIVGRKLCLRSGEAECCPVGRHLCDRRVASDPFRTAARTE